LTDGERAAVWEISSYPTRGCGVGEYARQLAEALNKGDLPTMHVHLTARDGLMPSMRNLLSFLSMMRTRRPRTIHVQNTPPTTGPFIPFIYLAAKVMDVRLVITSHERPTPYLKHIGPRPLRWLFLRYDRWVNSCGDLTIVHSSGHRNELVANGVPQVNVRVMPIGVSRTALADVEEIERFRREEGMMDRRVITFFGIIRPNKGVHTLIRAFASLARFDGESHLMIAGAVPKECAEYGGELRGMVEELGIADRVTFTGFVPDDRIALVMGSSDIVVLPYTESTQSGVLLWQGVAYMKPLVVADVGGLKEFVENRKVGLLFKAGDHSMLKERLEELLKDDDYREAMVVEMAKTMEELDWTRLVPDYIEMLSPK